jgi:hypothetical protein
MLLGGSSWNAARGGVALEPYDPEAAKLAGTRTLEFFNKHLR